MNKNLSIGANSKHLGAFPALVLFFSLLLTFAVTFYVFKTTNSSNLAHFANATNQIEDDIRDRMDSCVTLLRGSAGLFAADEHTTREQFHAYVERLLLSEQYQGIQGIGLAPRVIRPEREPFLKQVRESGLTNFAIFPEGDREEYFPIVFLEPPDRRNLAAIGYDMYSEPARHAAMALAMTNGIAASSRVILVQEIDSSKQAGFLIYLAVYRGGGFPPTTAERKEKLIGFVYSPFRADDFFTATFAPEKDLPLHLEIYDGDRVEENRLLHRSSNVAAVRPMLCSTNTIQTAGHEWTIVYQTTPEFEDTLQRRSVPGVFVAGSLVSIALFGIAVVFVRAREIKRQSDQALRASEELYRTTTESVADLIILIDTESTILSANTAAERIFGYTKEELLGRSLTSLMPERMRHRHREGFARYLQSGKKNIPWSGVELPGLHKNGHEVPVEISFGEIRQDGKRVFAGIVRDITERKRAENSLRESEERYRVLSRELENRVKARTQELAAINQELEAFTYSVAHDLRAPLRHINGFAQLLEETGYSQLSPEGRNYIQRMAASAVKMSRLVDGLLSFALLGKAELVHQKVALRTLAEEARAFLQDEIHARHIEWEIEDLPSAECDPSLIRQVFVHLLSNAIKYTRRCEIARIHVGRTMVKDQPTVFVRDNGIGFDMRYIEKLFGVFQRLETTEEFEGTGIGLAMASRIIQKHRGQIWAQAEEGRGATFYFSLPRMV